MVELELHQEGANNLKGSISMVRFDRSFWARKRGMVTFEVSALHAVTLRTYTSHFEIMLSDTNRLHYIIHIKLSKHRSKIVHSRRIKSAVIIKKRFRR